jgi:hypothetical protein
VLLAFFKFCAKIENRIVSFFGNLKKKKSEKVSRATKERTDELLDDEFFAVDNGLKSLSISQLGIREERSDRSLEENPTLQSKVHHKSAEENYKPKAAEKQSYVDNDWGFHGASERKFNENDIIYEDSATSRNTMSERAAYGLDCSADEIFTKSFSPIDFALDSAERTDPRQRDRLTQQRLPRQSFARACVLFPSGK